MTKYEVSIVFGHSFLNTLGQSIYGDGKTRKVILKGEADNEEMAVVAANVAFGVEFKSGIIAKTYDHKVGEDSVLVLHVK